MSLFFRRSINDCALYTGVLKGPVLAGYNIIRFNGYDKNIV